MIVEHVAVLKGRYLEMLLVGSKRIECRLMRRALRPYNVVRTGQTIWFKRSGGWIEACGRARRVRHIDNLTPSQIDLLKQKYNDSICGTDDFWKSRRDCRYATLVWLENVHPVPLFKLENLPRSPWAVLEKKVAMSFEKPARH